MEVIINFLNEYGILSAVITAVASALGVLAKKIWDKVAGDKIKDETKKDLAETVIKYVEQVYKDIHGEEKLEAALDAFANMLAQKGISISELEMRVYLEAALAKFNDAFTKSAEYEKEKSVETVTAVG